MLTDFTIIAFTYMNIYEVKYVQIHVPVHVVEKNMFVPCII